MYSKNDSAKRKCDSSWFWNFVQSNESATLNAACTSHALLIWRTYWLTWMTSIVAKSFTWWRTGVTYKASYQLISVILLFLQTTYILEILGEVAVSFSPRMVYKSFTIVDNKTEVKYTIQTSKIKHIDFIFHIWQQFQICRIHGRLGTSCPMVALLGWP